MLDNILLEYFRETFNTKYTEQYIARGTYIVFNNRNKLIIQILKPIAILFKVQATVLRINKSKELLETLKLKW